MNATDNWHKNPILLALLNGTGCLSLCFLISSCMRSRSSWARLYLVPFINAINVAHTIQCSILLPSSLSWTLWWNTSNHSFQGEFASSILQPIAFELKAKLPTLKTTSHSLALIGNFVLSNGWSYSYGKVVALAIAFVPTQENTPPRLRNTTRIWLSVLTKTWQNIVNYHVN